MKQILRHPLEKLNIHKKKPASIAECRQHSTRTMNFPSDSRLRFEWLGRINFHDALLRQEAAVRAVKEEGETIFLLEHEPVFTIGRTRDLSSLRNPSALPFPVVETNRGGQATYHGPGQLVGYLILDLDRRGRDLHAYLRILEECLIATCGAFGVRASRRDGLTGVWVRERKIASIGIGVRKWITMHGFALNVSRVDAFQHITPCGISGVQMTSLEGECTRPPSMVQVVEAVAPVLARRLFVDQVPPPARNLPPARTER
jgi:lipoyl(octanoyl) transferase